VTPCQSVGGQAECDETQRLLDLREAQLADCTRAMREVSTAIREWCVPWLRDDAGQWRGADEFSALADKLDAARAGKAVA